MRFNVYVAGMYVDTIEAESEEKLVDVADEIDEMCREWASENMHWEPEED